MSYLDRPRIHFYGKVSVNPPTANNTAQDWNAVRYYDPALAELDLRGRSPEQFREWFHTLNYEGYVNALWNYYGDNGLRFDEVKITSAELPDNRHLTTAEEDSCIGSTVHLMGSPYRAGRSPAVLVDLDPTDGFTTQLFSEYFSISRDSQPLLEASSATKSYANWINFWRNLQMDGDSGSSAMWQLAFPKESVQFMQRENSPAMRALEAAVEREQGLVMRLCFYLFYHRTYREVAQAYEANRRVSLPGSLVMMGTLGAWSRDEPATLPIARILMPDPAYALQIPDDIESQRRHIEFYPGVTFAKTDTERKVIILDLVNTFPEVAGFNTLDETLNNVPEKVNLGDISLNVIDPASQNITCIGVIPFHGQPPAQVGYDTAGTFRAGGIIEMPYPPELESQIVNGDLVLLHGTDANSPVLVRESPYYLLLDQRGIYLELEDHSAVEIPFRVMQRGQALTESIVLRVEQTLNQSSRISQQPNLLMPKPPDPDHPTPQHTHIRPMQQTDSGDAIVEGSREITTDAQGYGVLALAPLRAGMCKVWLYPPHQPDLSVVSLNSIRYFLKNALHYFVNVRVLPDDSHYDAVPDEALTWEYLYEHFFRYYSLLYPIMNSYINFDDPVETRAKAALIRAFVDDNWQHSTLYMPITREMSAGKRRLVQRWADLQR